MPWDAPTDVRMELGIESLTDLDRYMTAVPPEPQPLRTFSYFWWETVLILLPNSNTKHLYINYSRWINLWELWWNTLHFYQQIKTKPQCERQRKEHNNCTCKSGVKLSSEVYPVHHITHPPSLHLAKWNTSFIHKIQKHNIGLTWSTFWSEFLNVF